ncbi:SAR2788 family putative toxin [Metabacillus sp. 113a]|uniref:SAR2788 family putative toxin n=1 Tax=Metabacillus sp. 113a TaxID=3404706 RepID=UPI003CF24143
MKKQFFNNFIVLLVITLIFSSLPLNTVFAEGNTTNNSLQETVLTNTLEKELEEENISLENLELTTEELIVETSLETANDESADATIVVEAGSDIIKVNTEEVDEDGKVTQKEYDVKIEQSSEDEIEANFEDVDTGEEYNFDSEEGSASLVFLIPLGLVMTPAVLTALFHTGAMIIVGGAAYVIATQANKSKSYYHFAATVKSGGVYIGKGLSKASAVARIKSGRDTWSTSSNQAKGVAASANPSGKPINEVDTRYGKPRKGYYYHWHPYKRTPKAHAFYGGPVK